MTAQLPLNTHGGQLSAGRLHGYGFLHEAAMQMWGEAGDRQIATPPEVGVVAAGGGNTCGCLLLVRDRPTAVLSDNRRPLWSPDLSPKLGGPGGERGSNGREPTNGPSCTTCS